ncbi:MAG: SRPBCC family protein [Hyphomicrobiaceae bacterium]|nr:SRPBCC family protein [Hyphomicrobiaceae bacterium]
MSQIEIKELINVDAERVFAMLLDTGALVKMFSVVRSVKEIGRSLNDDGTEETRCRISGGFNMINLDVDVVQRVDRAGRVLVSELSGSLLKAMTVRIEVTPEGERFCEATFNIDYEFGLLSPLRLVVNKPLLDLAVDGYMRKIARRASRLTVAV